MNWQDEQKKVATGVTGGQEFTGLMGKPCCGDFENCWQPCTPRGKFLGALDAKREWVGLTHEEIDYQAKKDDHGVYFALGALWAEAKLKALNT